MITVLCEVGYYDFSCEVWEVKFRGFEVFGSRDKEGYSLRLDASGWVPLHVFHLFPTYD